MILIEHANIDDIWNSGCVTNFVKFCSSSCTVKHLTSSFLLHYYTIDPARKTTKFNIFETVTTFYSYGRIYEFYNILVASYGSFGNKGMGNFRCLDPLENASSIYFEHNIPQNCSLLVKDHLYRFLTQSKF